MNIGAGIGVGFSSPREEPFFEYEQSQACENGSDVTPIINNPGGTFSASPAGLSINSSTGVIDVSASTVGTYTVTYSIGPTEDTITILPADDSSFSYSASSFRQNASNPAPTITGLVGGVFSAPSGIVFTDSSSGIINLAASTVGGPYTITYTTTGNCPTSSTFDVTVQVALSITYSAASFCEDGGNTAAPTVVGDPGSGTFASTTGLSINSTTGVINTDTSTPDDNTPYIVTYTASTGETVTTQVTIKNLDNATFSYSATSFCENASNQTPTITTPGGTFTTQDISFRPFQMQFEVAPGVSKTITIPNTVGSSYTVNWGDGATTTESTGTITHTYNDGNNTDVTNPTVSIGAEGDTGAFTSCRFANAGSKSDLLDISQWGDIVWSRMDVMFYGCNNTSFQISATDYPNISNISSAGFNRMFQSATYFNSDIGHWDVSNCPKFTQMFYYATNFNNGGSASINNWDTSSVLNLSFMFYFASNFNQPVGNWDLSSATDINRMFWGASNFNQDLSNWNLSSVTGTGLNNLFKLTAFNNGGSANINNWNIQNATGIYGMFLSSQFNQNIGGWNIASLTNANSMFPSTMSQVNYTDTLVGWANYVYTNSAPYNASFTGNSFSSKFDGTRSGGANFSTAQDAYNYLVGATASWTIS